MAEIEPLATAPRSDAMPKGPDSYDPHTAARCFIIATCQIYQNHRPSPQELVANPALMKTFVGEAIGDGSWFCSWAASGTQAMLHIDKEAKTALLAFRGTSDLEDVVADATFMEVDADDALDNAHIECVYENDSCYGKSRGTTFIAALRTAVNPCNWLRRRSMAVRGTMNRGIMYTRWLEDICAKQVAGGVDSLSSLVVTGHSLGGATAHAFAYWFAAAHPAVRLDVYTFESPQLGNFEFAAEYLRRVPRSFAHVFDVDIVPRVVPWMVHCYAHKITFVLHDRPAVLGYNPLNWILHLHLCSTRVFVPWMQAAYPGVYEQVWAELEGKPAFFEGGLSTLGRECAKCAPNNSDHLPASSFEAIWVERAAVDRLCFYRIMLPLAALWMAITVLGAAGILIALVVSAPGREFGAALADALFTLVSDEQFVAQLGAFGAAVAAIGVSAVLWLVFFSSVHPKSEASAIQAGERAALEA